MPLSALPKGKYAEAETLHEWPQSTPKKVLRPCYPALATVLHVVLRSVPKSPWFHLFRAFALPIQGKYEEADSLHLRAIDIGEKKLGPDHPNLATWLNNRAGLLENQVRAIGSF